MTSSEPINGIAAIHAFIKVKKKITENINVFACPSSINKLRQSLDFKFGDEVETIFLLKEDVFIELGPPQYESVSYIVITRNPEEVQDGRITVLGPDIPESEGKQLNFGQILLFGGAQIKDEEYKEMERAIFHLKNLEGFMIRAVPNKLWSRVSKNVGQRGFSLETLGKALMIMYKEQFSSIETMEILFITTDSPQDFLELKVLGSEVRKHYIQKYSATLKAKLTELVEKQRDDCDYPWTCDECDYNAVCDEVRDIVEKVKAYREKTNSS
ncbi:MAG: hypothetical protein HWN66_06435 [Candidatus Helarchaeota archaeon]|nr:hypothetical protein [Candidatus Helarchaeota archaeon]